MKQNIYQKIGCTQVINASGYMSKLGTSIISDSVAHTMYEASQNYFNINELYDLTSNRIKQLLNVEDSIIVNSAASGIALSCAAIIHEDKYLNIYDNLLPNQIIIPKGHNINFGVPIEVLLKMGGAEVVEVGWANECTREQVIEKITSKTKALIYIVSHHTVQKNMISLAEFIGIAKQYNLPVIVDAAAETDIKKYVELNPTLTILSTAKAINGPTGGIIFGSSKYINFIRSHLKGLGRAMKISKENIVGVLMAFENYMNLSLKTLDPKVLNYLKVITDKLNLTNVLLAKIVVDQHRNIHRIQVSSKSNNIELLREINTKLQTANPQIYLRDYLLNENILEIDSRTLKNQEELDIIYQKLVEIVKEINNE